MILHTLLAAMLFAISLPAGAQDRVTVATQRSAMNGALFLAEGRGYFKDEGLTVEIRAFADDRQAVTALASGQFDLAVAEFTATAFNLAGKGAIKAIAGQARENPDFEGNEVVASIGAFNRGLKKMEDLAGRTIVISQFGSPFHYQMGQIARVKHFDIRSITLKQTHTLDAASAAVTSDKADAAILPVHYARELLMAGQVRLIGWYSEIDQQQLGALFASTRTIESKRATVEKFVRAYRRGAAEFTGALMRRDRFAKRITDKRSQAVAAIVGRYVYPHLSLDRATLAIETTAYYLDPKVRLDAADVARQVEWFQSQGLVDASVDPKAMIDPSFNPGLK